ncbi:MAG: hypothetical protein K2O03_10085 [Lachnospiraceae bacterium]|nr:hypothetical protein [Lachnospiraceae bacterium]
MVNPFLFFYNILTALMAVSTGIAVLTAMIFRNSGRFASGSAGKNRAMGKFL